jgi:hypothetical protein
VLREVAALAPVAALVIGCGSGSHASPTELADALTLKPFPTTNLPAGTTIGEVEASPGSGEVEDGSSSSAPSSIGIPGVAWHIFVRLHPTVTASGESYLYEIYVFDPGYTAPTPYGTANRGYKSTPVASAIPGSQCFGISHEPRMSFFCGWPDKNVFGVCSGQAASQNGVNSYCGPLFENTRTLLQQADPGGGF